MIDMMEFRATIQHWVLISLMPMFSVNPVSLAYPQYFPAYPQ
jgi:hypothetical protein